MQSIHNDLVRFNKARLIVRGVRVQGTYSHSITIRGMHALLDALADAHMLERARELLAA